MIIKKAVFPIAGLGTRFLPATKASPKEMLPIVDKPLIQYAVEEAYAAGIRQMIFVTGRHKRAVEDHFDTSVEHEIELENSGKTELLRLIRSIKPKDMDCIYIRQPHALGLGHAVLCAENLIGQEPFAVLLADDLMVGETPILLQMLKQFHTLQTSILAVQEVPRTQTRRYGIVAGTSIDAQLVDVSCIVEKPAPEQSPSTLGVAGRYLLTPGIFKYLANQCVGIGNEIQLTDGIAGLLQTERVIAYRYEGLRYDCGSKLGFLQATVDFAVRHEEIGVEFSAWLEYKRESKRLIEKAGI